MLGSILFWAGLVCAAYIIVGLICFLWIGVIGGFEYLRPSNPKNPLHILACVMLAPVVTAMLLWETIRDRKNL